MASMTPNTWDANFWVVTFTHSKAVFEITLAYTKQPTSLTDSSVNSSETFFNPIKYPLLL